MPSAFCAVLAVRRTRTVAKESTLERTATHQEPASLCDEATVTIMAATSCLLMAPTRGVGVLQTTATFESRQHDGTQPTTSHVRMSTPAKMHPTVTILPAFQQVAEQAVPSAASNARWSSLLVQGRSPQPVGTGRTTRGTAVCAATKSATFLDSGHASGFAEKKALWVHGVAKTNIAKRRVLLATIGVVKNLNQTTTAVTEMPNATVATAICGGVCKRNAGQRKAGKTIRTASIPIIANPENVSTPLAPTSCVCRR